MSETTTPPEPRWTVYSGRLLNPCLEEALLSSYGAKPSAPAPRLAQLARSRYVRERLTA